MAGKIYTIRQYEEIEREFVEGISLQSVLPFSLVGLPALNGKKRKDFSEEG